MVTSSHQDHVKKIGRMVTYLEELLLVRSSDKQKSLCLYHSAYVRQTWQDGNLT